MILKWFVLMEKKDGTEIHEGGGREEVHLARLLGREKVDRIVTKSDWRVLH